MAYKVGEVLQTPEAEEDGREGEEQVRGEEEG